MEFNSHGARPVHLIITMIKWSRTSRLSIKNSLSRGVPVEARREPALLHEGHGIVEHLLRVRALSERESFIGDLLVRINFTIVMIRWTGLAPWEFRTKATA